MTVAYKYLNQTIDNKTEIDGSAKHSLKVQVFNQFQRVISCSGCTLDSVHQPLDRQYSQ